MWHYIYNRLRREGYMIKNEIPMRMYPCFGMDDNVLLACCLPTELPLITDRRFMTQQQIEIMEKLKDDDNSVIVKYYLRK